MKHYSNTQHMGGLDLVGNFLSNVTLPMMDSFPTEPKVGSFIFKDKRVMVCLDLASSPVWIPLTQELNTYIHSQDEAAVTWTIQHNMNSTSVIVQCFDENNRVIIPKDIESTDNNTVTVSFDDVPVFGQAIVIIGNFDGTPKPDVSFELEFTDKTTVNVNHMLGYEPLIRVIVDGYEIQPDSVQHTDVNSAVVTFSASTTGKIIAI
ncbi:hypothetical protein BN7874_120 [Phage NCTB]|nr:hypothetical protein BN7874_120 [Phage NCTB]